MNQMPNVTISPAEVVISCGGRDKKVQGFLLFGEVWERKIDAFCGRLIEKAGNETVTDMTILVSGKSLSRFIRTIGDGHGVSNGSPKRETQIVESAEEAGRLLLQLAEMLNGSATVTGDTEVEIQNISEISATH